MKIDWNKSIKIYWRQSLTNVSQLLKYKNLLISRTLVQFRVWTIYPPSKICLRIAKQHRHNRKWMILLMRNTTLGFISDMIIARSKGRNNYLLLVRKKLIKKLPCIRLLYLFGPKIVNGCKIIGGRSFKDILIQLNLGFIIVKTGVKLLLPQWQRNFPF